MRKWIMRWIAYLLLPAGVVLLFLPLSTYRAEYVEQSCLFLGVTETLDGTSAAYGGYPLLHPDSLAPYPTLQAAILEIIVDLDRFRQSPTLSLPRQEVTLEEWERFQPLHAPNGMFQYENQVFKGRLSLGYPIEYFVGNVTDDQIWALFPTSAQIGMDGVQPSREKSKLDDLSGVYLKSWAVGRSGRVCNINLTLYGSDEISKTVWDAVRGTVKGQTARNVGDDAYIMDKGPNNSYRAVARFRNAHVFMTD